MFAVLNCIPLPQRPFYQSAGIIGQFREGKKLQKIPNAARFLWELVVIIGQFKRFARWTRCKKRVLPCNGGRQEPRLQRLPNFGQIISSRLYLYICQRYIAYIPFNDWVQIIQIWSCKDPLSLSTYQFARLRHVCFLFQVGLGHWCFVVVAISKEWWDINRSSSI